MAKEIKHSGISKDTGDRVYGYYGILGKGTYLEKHVIIKPTLNLQGRPHVFFTDIIVDEESVRIEEGLNE